PQVENNLAAGGTYQLLGCLDIHGIKLMRLQQAGATLTTFFLDGSNDCFALAERTRGDMNIAEQNVVLCAFMRCHMSHAAGTDDKNIAFHWITPQSRKHEQY